jgi:hypothetical protein
MQGSLTLKCCDDGRALHNHTLRGPDHMSARHETWCKQHKPRPAPTSRSSAGLLLSPHLSLSMTNHATASTSTHRCAKCRFPCCCCDQTKPCSLSTVSRSNRAPFTHHTKSCLDSPRLDKQCVSLEIKPNLVGSCIQKRLNDALGLLLH